MFKEYMIKNNTSSKVEYVSVVDGKNLQEIETIEGDVLIAIATQFSQTRLIDNIKIRG